MKTSFSILLLLSLAGCAGLPQSGPLASACTAGEATYACQVERYHNVNAQ